MGLKDPTGGPLDGLPTIRPCDGIQPPMDIYAECLLRTMTTNGLLILTFTPLQGLTELVLSFLPGGRLPPEEGGDG